jgi:AAHS family 4-hydroxybenzoate transporter-like MFS transporter
MPRGNRSYLVLALCSLVLLIDGFDTQAISYIAPVLAKTWHLSKGALGPIFSAALVGLMIGYLFVSPASDRFGHKRVIAVSTIVFALFTFATVFANNLTALIVLRFLTGIGLGAAAPSAVALTSEFAPARLRATFVLIIYCGFSLGFIIAGLLADRLLPLFGWTSLLWVGAATPLLLAAVVLRWLPESRAAQRTEARNLGEVFAGGRLWGSLLLWFAFLVNLGEFYFMQSWLPTLLTNDGHPLGMVVAATTLSTVGGIVAAFIMGPAMDRISPSRTVAIVFLVGSAAVAVTGAALGAAPAVLFTATFVAGFFVSGGQKSLIALSAIFYPAQTRSTGVGWALGIGRFGGIAGPLLAGAFLAHGTPTTLFYVAAVPMFLAGIAVFAINPRLAPAVARMPDEPGDRIGATA